jgi:hypothetical protein
MQTRVDATTQHEAWFQCFVRSFVKGMGQGAKNRVKTVLQEKFHKRILQGVRNIV